MAPPKCIMHDSACVPDAMTDVSTPVVKDAWRHFGLWVPPIYYYALHDADANTDRLKYFHRPDFVDLAGTIANLNRLKTEFGFNAISIGVDDFIYVYTWTPFLLFDVFMHQDCVWLLDELLLSIGNRCHVWGLRVLHMFRELTGDANALADSLDEPMLHSILCESCAFGYRNDSRLRLKTQSMVRFFKLTLDLHGRVPKGFGRSCPRAYSVA